MKEKNQSFEEVLAEGYKNTSPALKQLFNEMDERRKQLGLQDDL